MIPEPVEDGGPWYAKMIGGPYHGYVMHMRGARGEPGEPVGGLIVGESVEEYVPTGGTETLWMGGRSIEAHVFRWAREDTVARQLLDY
jgi:hypothetical protein